VDKRCTQGFVGKPEGNTPLGRSRCRWEDNIKIDETICLGRDLNWISLAQDMDKWRAIMNTVMKLRAGPPA
jgi:hypothetical protein